MSVGLQKLDGVETVDLSLNDGHAAIRLKAGNRVTLQQIHGLVRSYGFTPREATITLRATVRVDVETQSVDVTGSGERFRVLGPLSADLSAALRLLAGAEAMIEGTIAAADDPDDTARIQITRLTPIDP